MIRPGTDADVRAIAELEVRAWRWAYVDFVADEDMISVEDRVARWTGPSADDTSVAEVEGRIAGVVAVGPGELRSLYVEPAAQGAGIGTALHEHACAKLRAAGYAEAMLWVFEDNGHARGFYERRGWVADGATRATGEAPELRYRQNLAR